MSVTDREHRPLERSTVHAVIDMQRLFAETTDWQVPTLPDILPAIIALAQAHPTRTIYTRFITPRSPQDAHGDWQRFYERWRSVVRDRMAEHLFELVQPLAALASPGEIYDKTVYSAFSNPKFVESLAQRKAETLVLSGVETDVCVLATAFDAVDRGLHVIVAKDAITSWSAAGHRAALESIYTRLDRQIELMTSTDILARWPKD